MAASFAAASGSEAEMWMPSDCGGADDSPASTASTAFQASLLMESIMSSRRDCSAVSECSPYNKFRDAPQEGTYDWGVLEMLRKQRVLRLDRHGD